MKRELSQKTKLMSNELSLFLLSPCILQGYLIVEKHADVKQNENNETTARGLNLFQLPVNVVIMTRKKNEIYLLSVGVIAKGIQV